MSGSRYLHFTLGPVQGFVAQARRTRDLWAGSYLLSYLAGRAMLAAGGEIVFPATAHDALFKALQGHTPGKGDLATQVGSLPNRFVVRVDDADAGNRARDAVQDAWRKIGDVVRERFVLQATKSSNDRSVTDEIWQRQIEGFWDCTWVYGDDGALLDQRKNLRTHFPPEEPGEKCTVCGERQEISGLGLGSAASRKAMRDWWAGFRDRGGLSALDLRDKERLCAVCLTKRLFPRVTREAIGWDVPIGFPSVSYMAAIDWLRLTLDKAKEPEVEKVAREYVEACKSGGVGFSEKETRIAGISERLRNLDKGFWQEFADLDGNAFFEEAILSSNGLALAREGKRQELARSLNGLRDAVGSSASPFFAMLLMDGDSMGKLLGGRAHEEKKRISDALGAFTRQVPEIVRQHDGRLIYCGGDDVFALLPLDQAVACALACRQAYMESFREHASFVEDLATISAAIVYAHIHVPLTTVTKTAHRLLELEAKDRAGRDALACQVFKPGGIQLTWSMPWQSMLEVEGSHPTLLDEVLWRFRENSEDPSQFSSKFFYKARDTFELLTDRNRRMLLSDEEVESVMVAEYMANREVDWPRKWEQARREQEARCRVRRLLALCTEQVRQMNESGKPCIVPTGGLNVDGALLVRFLAQKGME